MIDTGLAGRVVLVTGANRGIGAAIARAFTAEGARVARPLPRPPGRTAGRLARAAALEPGRR